MDNETLQLFVVGINYKTSTISEREIFQINRKEISHSLNYFNSRKEVEGVVIVSTCNRLEFYLVLKQDAHPFDIVNDFYFEKKKISANQKQNLFYIYSGTECSLTFVQSNYWFRFDVAWGISSAGSNKRSLQFSMFSKISR